MSDRDFFERTEFSSARGPQTPEEAIKDRHDPEVAYAHILKLAASTDAGLDAVPDDQQTAAEVYTAVDLFRATIQYVEEFGTYLHSQAVQDKTFIESLIQTSAGNLVPFFDACQEATLEDYLADHDVDMAPDTWLGEIFGYQQMQDGRIQPPSDDCDDRPTDDELDEYIDDSLAFIKAELAAIASFYQNFKEAYNAVKHGNRVMVAASPRFTVESEETTATDLETDDPYVSFLCKESGDESSGHPYILTVPTSFLERWALDIADRVHNLYTHAYDITTVRDGEQVTVDFYKAGASGGGETITYHTIQDQDGSIIVPSEDVPDQVHEFELEDGTSVELVGAWSLSGNTLQFEVEYATQPTPEYPIEVSVSLERHDGRLRELGTGHFNFSVDPGCLSISQYLELLEIWEQDDIAEIEFEFPGEDATHSISPDEPFEGIKVPDPDDRGFLEFVERIELATQTRIPFPLAFSEEHYEVYEAYQDESLDRDTAETVLSEFEAVGEDIHQTQVFIEEWNDSWDKVENTDSAPKQVHDLGLVPGGITIEDDDVEASRGDPGEFMRSEPAPSTYSVQDVIDEFDKHGIAVIEDLNDADPDSDQVETNIGYKVGFGAEMIWGTFDVLYVAVFAPS